MWSKILGPARPVSAQRGVLFVFFFFILQLMENATHTFLQLSQQHLGQAAGRRQLTQMLGKVKERVLKVRQGSLSMGLFRWSLVFFLFSVEHPPSFAAFRCVSLHFCIALTPQM